ncbi:MAG: C4-dicarboxylate ABC transporter, partial [Pseudomonas sp.]
MPCLQQTTSPLRPLSHLAHPREVIRQFTPNWFAATMGTGVLALALMQIGMDALHGPAEALWWLTIALFVLFSVLYAARWLMFFNEARQIFAHSTVSMFFGTIPMGLATILNGFLLFGINRWGEGIVPWIEALWWFDVG